MLVVFSTFGSVLSSLLQPAHFMHHPCSLCGRKSAHNIDRKTGLCRTCQPKMQEMLASYQHRSHDVYLPYQPGDDIKLRRDGDRLIVNVPRVFTRHSPDGYAWGYPGSGPAELALNILLLFADYATANPLYQDFKQEFLADLPSAGGNINATLIQAWLAMHNALATVTEDGY